MLINCKIDSSYYQVYLASENSDLGVEKIESGFSYSNDCLYITTAWEGIEGEVSLTLLNDSPPEKLVHIGNAEIFSPNRRFELSDPTAPGGGIIFESDISTLKIKIFTDGKETPNEVALQIENAQLSVIGYGS